MQFISIDYSSFGTICSQNPYKSRTQGELEANN